MWHLNVQNSHILSTVGEKSNLSTTNFRSTSTSTSRHRSIHSHKQQQREPEQKILNPLCRTWVTNHRILQPFRRAGESMNKITTHVHRTRHNKRPHLAIEYAPLKPASKAAVNSGRIERTRERAREHAMRGKSSFVKSLRNQDILQWIVIHTTIEEKCQF